MWEFIPKDSVVIEPKNVIAVLTGIIIVGTLLYLFSPEVDSEGNYLGPSGLTKILRKLKKEKKG